MNPNLVKVYLPQPDRDYRAKVRSRLDIKEGLCSDDQTQEEP